MSNTYVYKSINILKMNTSKFPVKKPCLHDYLSLHYEKKNTILTVTA